jgi:hypothetical protein
VHAAISLQPTNEWENKTFMLTPLFTLVLLSFVTLAVRRPILEWLRVYFPLGAHDHRETSSKSTAMLGRYDLSGQ